MSPQQLDRLRSILSAALEIPPERRAAFLQSECEGDDALRLEVEALLSIHGSAGDFLKQTLPELLRVEMDGSSELPAGTLIKQRYRIHRRMAESSFGSVYLAFDGLLGDMPVVVKALDRITDPATLQDLIESELRALSQVRHPNVVGISDIGTLDGGTPFLVLEFVPGATLRELLRQGPVDQGRARSILRGIGRALSAAHKAGVWHLDIKPENVIVFEPGSDEERVKLIDFGIARFKSLNRENPLAAGSPNYMAPEQEEKPSAACDIYALSLVAFEVFTGHLPLSGKEVAAQLPGGLGARTARAIVKGLELNPTKRPTDVATWLGDVTESANKSWKIYAVLAAVVSVVVAAILLFFKGAASTNGQPEYSKPFPFVASPAVEDQPAFSPDGKVLYFARGRDGKRDIYKKTIPYGEPMPVVTDPADDEDPQVSPDGRILTFVRNGEKSELIAKDLITGKEEILGRGPVGDAYDSYSWAADGKRIVVSSFSNGSQTLQVIDVQTKRVERLNIPEPFQCQPYYPSLSPDGNHIAFACRWSRGKDDLFVAEVGADLKEIRNVLRLTRKRERIASLGWTPDSRTVFYVSGPLGAGSIWRSEADGTRDPIPAFSTYTRVESIALARTARKLAFGQDASEPKLLQYRLGSAEQPRELLPDAVGDENGVLSPDGKMLLFSSSRSGSYQEWVANADGSNARQITNFQSAEVVAAIWSADSQAAIISVRSPDLGERIYNSPINGGRAMTTLLEGAWVVSISRDGKWLYFRRTEKGKRSIWRTELANPVRIERITEAGVYGMESWDGRWFYFSKQSEREGIWKQPLPSGVATQVVKGLRRRNLFVVGQLGITYVAPSKDVEHPVLYRQGPEQNVAPQPLYVFPYDIGWGLSLSPDEKTVIFSHDPGDYNVILVEAFR